MRTLIVLLSFLIPFSLQAKETGTLLLTVKVKRKYASELSRVFRRADGLICVTELSPLVPVKEKQFSAFLAAAEEFRAKSEVKKKDCAELVMVAIPGKKPGAGCTDTGKDLIKIAAESCGRL